MYTNQSSRVLCSRFHWKMHGMPHGLLIVLRFLIMRSKWYKRVLPIQYRFHLQQMLVWLYSFRWQTILLDFRNTERSNLHSDWLGSVAKYCNAAHNTVGMEITNQTVDIVCKRLVYHPIIRINQQVLLFDWHVPEDQRSLRLHRHSIELQLQSHQTHIRAW